MNPDELTPEQMTQITEELASAMYAAAVDREPSQFAALSEDYKQRYRAVVNAQTAHLTQAGYRIVRA